MTRSHRPRKRFGQHFLAPAWARKVVAAIAPERRDVFLEIGPGTGALTLPLAARGVPILAIEIDRDLAAELAPRVPAAVTVMTADIMAVDPVPFLTGLVPQRPPDEPRGPFSPRLRVVGNLPYNLSTPLLFRLLAWHRTHDRFFDATVMVQREVADRLIARPHTPEYGVLGISVQVHAHVERLLDLPPGAFSPRPKIQSTVIRLTFRPPAIRILDEPLFERLLRGLFSQRRKTLLNGLRRFDPALGEAELAAAEIDSRRRPETLTLEEFGRLAEIVTRRGTPPAVL